MRILLLLSLLLPVINAYGESVLLGSNVMKMAHQIRKFSPLYRLENALSVDQQVGYNTVQNELFPWLLQYGSIANLAASFVYERGIVFSTGNKFVRHTQLAINFIRSMKCNLPIEIFYGGESDLSIKNVEFLNSMVNVKTVDASLLFNMTMLELRGSDLKPFAMLGASFKEVLLMDADVLFAQSPELLFEDAGYKSTGALFYYDRQFRYKEINYVHWFNNNIPLPNYCPQICIEISPFIIKILVWC